MFDTVIEKKITRTEKLHFENIERNFLITFMQTLKCQGIKREYRRASNDGAWAQSVRQRGTQFVNDWNVVTNKNRITHFYAVRQFRVTPSAEFFGFFFLILFFFVEWKAIFDHRAVSRTEKRRKRRKLFRFLGFHDVWLTSALTENDGFFKVTHKQMFQLNQCKWQWSHERKKKKRPRRHTLPFDYDDGKLKLDFCVCIQSTEKSNNKRRHQKATHITTPLMPLTM